MDPETIVASDEQSKGKRRSLIRKRPVSFGISRNYHGNVYTIPNDDRDDDDASTDEDSILQTVSAVNRRIVAMIGVPPEHVPEGIVDLIRSHRQFVEHVRVVIADSDDENDGDGNWENNEDGCDEKEEEGDFNSNEYDFENASITERRDRTYLILVQLFREEDATTFVEDLDGKPYIAFDDRDICQIERVARVETAEAMSKTDTPGAILPQQQNNGLQQSDGKSSKNLYHETLPLLHPNFGTTIFDNTADGESSQEKKMGEQKTSSQWTKVSGNRDDCTLNCAVCLEDLKLEEKKIDGANALLASTEGSAPAVCTVVPTSQPSLLTTVCNHTFHLDCLQRCTGPCPVCRYDHSGLNETLSECHVCGRTENSYVCLICGVVSCGVPRTAEAVPPVAAAASASSTTASPSRFYTSSHAGKHYQDTLHAYALDTETQHVYDFCGQGYVHRLVQNKEDGKIVEINDPRQSSAGSRGRLPGERSLTPGLSDTQEGEVIHRKLESAAEQYNNLLKSQLEQQRAHYEKYLNNLKREFSVDGQKAKAEDLLRALREEQKQANKRLSTLKQRKAKVDKNVVFLKNMNESLESNKVALKKQIEEAVREQKDSKDMNQRYTQALTAKLTDLMKQLDESIDN